MNMNINEYDRIYSREERSIAYLLSVALHKKACHLSKFEDLIQIFNEKS